MSAGAGGALSPQAEAILSALSDLAADSPAEIRALAMEVIQTMSAREIALIVIWRDGCRGSEPEHYEYRVTGAGDMVSSEFTRKSRLAIVAGKKKK